MQKMADDIQNNINIPLLHLVDTADKIKQNRLRKLGFWERTSPWKKIFTRRLMNKYGLDVVFQ